MKNIKHVFFIIAPVLLMSILIHSESNVLANEINVNITVEDTACFDGIDNDGDGKVDFPDDPGCSSTLDDDETDPVLPACSDGIDNDGDGTVDFPDDLGCDSATDNDESDDPPPTVSGGGGGGGGSATNRTVSLEYSGLAFPSATVYLLIDGTIIATTTADEKAFFSDEVSNLISGVHTFSFYSADSYGLTSDSISVTADIKRRSEVVMSDIFVPPTLWANKLSVSQGELIRIEGQTVPNTNTIIEIHSDNKLIATATTTSTDNGTYAQLFNTGQLQKGVHTAVARTISSDGQFGPYTSTVNFMVAEETIFSASRGCRVQGDLNKDCRVNLIDFSIMMFWWPLKLSPDFLTLEKERLSGDGRLSLVDFSVIAYYWTG